MVVLGARAVSYERGTPVGAVHVLDFEYPMYEDEGVRTFTSGIQGYLAYKKTPPPRTLP